MIEREKVFFACWALVALVVVVVAAYNIGVLHGGSRAISTFCAGETQ